MEPEYLQAIKFFQLEEKDETRKSLYDDLINQILLGDDMEAIAFDNNIVPPIRELARLIIRAASDTLEIKPNEENLHHLWLAHIKGLVKSDYYAACQNYVRNGTGSFYIEEHCRAFRLFWHSTIFAQL